MFSPHRRVVINRFRRGTARAQWRLARPHLTRRSSTPPQDQQQHFELITTIATMNKGFTNANWSKHAAAYEALAENLTAGWARDAVRASHARVLPLLSQDRALKLLDVGCGPGILTFELANKYADANIHITATDLADGMLDRVKLRLERSPFAHRIDTVQMDGRELDKVADGSVGVVGSNFGLSIFPERPRGWQSAHRVLQDGGVLVVTAWDAASANLKWFDLITNLYNEAGDGSESPMPPPSTLAGADLVEGELEAAGFRNIETFRTTHTIMEDFDALLGSVIDNPAASKFLERLSRETIMGHMTELLRDDTESIARQSGKSNDGKNPKLAAFHLTAVTFVASK